MGSRTSSLGAHLNWARAILAPPSFADRLWRFVAAEPHRNTPNPRTIMPRTRARLTIVLKYSIIY